VEHTPAYYKLLREVERYSHPLVHFYVRDVHERYDDELLHIDQLLTIEVYRLGRMVACKLIAVELFTLWKERYYSSMVQDILQQLLTEWILNSLRWEKEMQ